MTQDGHSVGNSSAAILVSGGNTPRTLPLVSPKTLLHLAQQTTTKSPVSTSLSLKSEQEMNGLTGIDTKYNDERNGFPPVKKSKSCNSVIS